MVSCLWIVDSWSFCEGNEVGDNLCCHLDDVALSGEIFLIQYSMNIILSAQDNPVETECVLSSEIDIVSMEVIFI